MKELVFVLMGTRVNGVHVEKILIDVFSDENSACNKSDTLLENGSFVSVEIISKKILP